MFVPAYSASQSFVFVLIVVFELLRSQMLLSDVIFMSGRLDQAPAGRVRRDTGSRGRGGGDRGERDDQL